MTKLPHRVLWRLAALFILVGACAMRPGGAMAHARLTDSSPVSGSALADMPGEIVLTFSEPVVPSSVNLALTRADGARIPLSGMQPAGDDHRVSIGIDQAAPGQGTFQLAWSVRSASDGHDSAGIIAFTVGTGRAPVGVSSTGAERDPWWQIGLRAVWLLALALVAAGWIGSVALRERLNRAILVGAGVGSIVAPLLVFRPWSEVDLAASSSRLQLAAGLAGFLASALSLVRIRATGVLSAIAWFGAIVCLAASGHAAGLARSTLAIAILSLHTALALAWLGALAAIIASTRPGAFGKTLVTYSRIAIGGVAVLGVAGVLFVPFQISQNGDIAGSRYGRTLLIKLGIVVLALAIAATNRWILRPKLAAAEPGATHQARIVMGAELAVLAVVVCLAAVLSATAPPGTKAITQVASPVRTVEQGATVDDLQVDLSASITGTVDDQFRIAVGPDSAFATNPIQRVIVTTSYRDPASGQIQPGERFDADQIATTGKYQFSALRLSCQAPWTVEVTVRRAGLLDSVVPFAIDTTEWQAEQPRITSRHWTWPIVPAAAWALVAFAALVPIVGITVIRRHGHVEPLSGAILMIALAMITTGFAIQAWQRTAPRTSGHDLVMPPDTDPVAAQTTYQTLCLACHGPHAAGIDTIDPLHQHGTGTNLTDPRSTLLSDGDLYSLISDGVGDTDMPAYDLALTDEERWNLVAFLRDMQAKSPGPATTAAPWLRFTDSSCRIVRPALWR
jgi:copper transport protein